MTVAVRGLRLFIREIDGNDHESVRDFLANHGATAAPPASGAVGKLLGDIVVIATTTEDGDTLRLDDLFVAPELRRKRIGRVMVDELVNIARTKQRSRVIVEQPGDAAEFLRKVGFEQHGERWERSV
jgi:GNAT superfamily N-acetyltransferase